MTRQTNTQISGKVPPPYQINVPYTRIWRFVYVAGTGSTATFTFTAAKLCALHAIGTTTTQVTQVYESVKVHSVEVYASSPNNATNVGVSVGFTGIAGGVQGNNRVVADMSMAMTKNAYIKAKPGQMDAAGLWQPGDVTASTLGTNTLFTIIIDPNGQSNVQFTVDVHCSLRHTANARTSATSAVAVTAAAVGSFYYMALDNNAAATGSTSNNFIPFTRDVPTTT